jgi:hypothetical protein
MILIILAKVIIGLGILNVWTIRASNASPWRGLDSINLKDEFTSYGLGLKMFYFVGGVKISASIALLVSIWYPELTLYSSVVLLATLLGSVIMHIKVKDPLKKCLPAISLILLLCFILM